MSTPFSEFPWPADYIPSRQDYTIQLIVSPFAEALPELADDGRDIEFRNRDPEKPFPGFFALVKAWPVLSAGRPLWIARPNGADARGGLLCVGLGSRPYDQPKSLRRAEFWDRREEDKEVLIRVLFWELENRVGLLLRR